MLPIGDRNPTRTTPFVNYFLLLANLLVYVWQNLVVLEGSESWLVPLYGLVPTRVLADPGGEAFTFVTSMFLHGSWLHLGGNLLFLYIFGDNVEDAIGHGRYALFYVSAGIVAGLAQIVRDVSSTIPMVGASGAIAGVLGAYLVLFPRAPVTVLNPPPLGFFMGFFLVLPAWVVVGLWFVYNLLSGVSSLGRIENGGVAFFAHIGGFVAGLLLVRPFHSGRPRVEHDRWQGWLPPQRRVPPPGRWS